MRHPGIELATSPSQVQRPNHYTTVLFSPRAGAFATLGHACKSANANVDFAYDLAFSLVCTPWIVLYRRLILLANSISFSVAAHLQRDIRSNAQHLSLTSLYARWRHLQWRHEDTLPVHRLASRLAHSTIRSRADLQIVAAVLSPLPPQSPILVRYLRASKKHCSVHYGNSKYQPFYPLICTPLMFGAKKCRIGCIGPLRQGKPAHRSEWATKTLCRLLGWG